MLNMSKILMVGSGPVAIQLARLCHLHEEHIVDMVSRVHASTKSKRVFDAYQRDGFFSVMTQNDAHQCFSGKFTVRHFFKDVKVLLMVPFDSEGKSCLVEVNGYIQADDSRLSGFEECIKNISVAGAYACPVSL